LLTVNGANVPPVSNAGTDISVTVGDAQTLNASASTDSDGTIASYQWRMAGTSIIIATGVNPALSPALPQGTHSIELTVTDDQGATSTDTVSLTVNSAANVPPLANAGTDISVTVGDAQTLDASASADSDGTIASYQWRIAGTTTVIATGVNPTLSPALAQGDYSIELTVIDDLGASDSDSISFIVNPFLSVPDLEEYETVFSDDFNGLTLDSSKWNTALLWGPYLPTNNEQQLYVDSLGMHSEFEYSPFTLTGDTLKITATPITTTLQPPERPPASSALWKPNSYSEYVMNYSVGSPDDLDYSPGYQESDVDYLSGIITSYGSFTMAHGYVEMRAKLPAGRGLWPAFWLLPQHYVKDVPEIDVMEFLGQDIDTLYQTYHYFDIEDNWTQISTPSFTVLADDWTQDFHTFGMAWSPTEIVWYVDGEESHRVTDSEYVIPNQPMHLLANLAVGGSWPGSPDELTEFPAVFEIDYMRAYKKKLNPELDLATDYQLMFSDDFTGNTLDTEKWNTHFLWGPYLPINNEEQYYVDALGSDSGGYSPFTLSGGTLSITARTADDSDGFTIPQTLPDFSESIWTEFDTFQRNLSYTPPSYTSGIITSYDAFKFANGYAEIRAKIPKGNGLWPAFWLLNGYYVGQQPEIDIMEVRGENPHEVVHSYHHIDNGLQSQSYTSTHPDTVDGYSDDFHTYGVRWQPGKIDWYIDGELKHTYEDSDVGYQVMYVIANLAVGGDFNHSSVDASLLPASLD
ncbi:family 16 glycosylhydrolase, partial [Granulosicoccus sp.]